MDVKEPCGSCSTIAELKDLMEKGEFHHATYRNRGTLWEGLWIYKKDGEGSRGFSVCGCFNAHNSKLLKEAEDIVRGTGISVGSYGNG